MNKKKKKKKKKFIQIIYIYISKTHVKYKYISTVFNSIFIKPLNNKIYTDNSCEMDEN